MVDFHEAPGVRAVTHRRHPPDPLGYDTSDFWACAGEVGAAAQSGRNADAVKEEIARVARRFGLPD